MNPPLLEVNLTIHFPEISLTPEKLQFFHHSVQDVLPHYGKKEGSTLCSFYSEGHMECMTIAPDSIELLGTGKVSFSRLRSNWEPLIARFLDVMEITEVTRISLLYLNEIELQNLKSFRNYLNISIDMPEGLMERIEFFRSEFTYKYDFGEIHVWLQPDWEEKTESYCIQLSLESRHIGRLSRDEVIEKLLQLHDGIKDVFHQILVRDYVDSLPS